jgi:hypothetical protein
MEVWYGAFPQSVLGVRAFFVQEKAERRAKEEVIHTC